METVNVCKRVLRPQSTAIDIAIVKDCMFEGHPHRLAQGIYFGKQSSGKDAMLKAIAWRLADEA